MQPSKDAVPDPASELRNIQDFTIRKDYGGGRMRLQYVRRPLYNFVAAMEVRAAHFVTYQNVLVGQHKLFDVATLCMVEDPALRASFDACNLTALEDNADATQNLFEFFIMTHIRGRLKDKLHVYVREEKERALAKRRQKRMQRKGRKRPRTSRGGGAPHEIVLHHVTAEAAPRS